MSFVTHLLRSDLLLQKPFGFLVIGRLYLCHGLCHNLLRNRTEKYLLGADDSHSGVAAHRLRYFFLEFREEVAAVLAVVV